ncbi:hypothetical protein Q3V23_00285 [Streptomyces sp. VNUA116]|nr:hypothetical protein [Streptomyces sp. VNUA116]WKU42635.1 hypothetical protein Q3V23_00285 [Streptomyces sp. VNUA116]
MRRTASAARHSPAPTASLNPEQKADIERGATALVGVRLVEARVRWT